MSHALSAFAGGTLFGFKSWKILLLGMVCAMIPDADVLSFNLGIPYGSIYGHRGITHGIPFAALWGLLMTLTFFFNRKKDWWKIWLFLFLCTASHGVFDAMTTGGKGIAFFAPFSAERYFMPWRVIKVSPIGIERFFSEWGWQVIKSEFLWIGLPSLVMVVVGKMIHRK